MYVPFYFFRMTNKTHYNYIWFPKFGDFLLGEITNNKDSITNNKVINLTRDVTKCEILYSQTWERKFLWFFVFRIWFHANFFLLMKLKTEKFTYCFCIPNCKFWSILESTCALNCFHLRFFAYYICRFLKKVKISSGKKTFLNFLLWKISAEFFCDISLLKML